MGLLNRFRKSSRVDDEDEDDDEIADDEEDEGEDEDDEDDEEETETGGGLFGKIRGLGGKLLAGGGDDDDEDEDDEEEEEEEDEYERPAASPSPPVQAVSKPSVETAPAQQNLTASLEGVTFEDPAAPSPSSTEDLPVSHTALIDLTEEDPSGDSPGAPDQTDQPSEETPHEEDDSSEVGMNLGNIFEKRVDIDQKLKSLAMSQEETPAEFLATELQDLLRELEELTPS